MRFLTVARRSAGSHRRSWMLPLLFPTDIVRCGGNLPPQNHLPFPWGVAHWAGVRGIVPHHWVATPEGIYLEGGIWEGFFDWFDGGNLLQNGPFISHFKNRELFPMFGKRFTFDL